MPSRLSTRAGYQIKALAARRLVSGWARRLLADAHPAVVHRQSGSEDEVERRQCTAHVRPCPVRHLLVHVSPLSLSLQ